MNLVDTPSTTRAASTLQLLYAAASVMANRALLRARLRNPLDGWRRAAGLVLRDDASMFVLSAFALDVWSDARGTANGSIVETQAHAAARLLACLRREPDCHIQVRRGEHEDIAEITNGPSYTIAFQDASSGSARFLPPSDWNGSLVGDNNSRNTTPLFNAVFRIDSSGHGDLWLRINHAGTDGVPMQDILSRIEASWGVRNDLVYPSLTEFNAIAAPRGVVGRNDLSEVQTLLDFSPLLAWRKRANAKLPQPLTVSAALLWCLAKHGGFSDQPYGTTVEIEATNELRRGVGVVVVRPADYFNRTNGLAKYAADFTREMEHTRRRTSAGCKTLDAAAFLSAPLARKVLRYGLTNNPCAFGTLGLTMLKNARVFGVPVAEVGHPFGFIAVGSVSLPTADGKQVGFATVKGPTNRVVEFPKMLQDAINACEREID